MNEQVYDDIALEKAAKALFGVVFDVDNVITRRFPVSHTGVATVFLTSKKQLYVYIDGQSKFLLGDIKKIVSRIGLKAELYLPPKGRPDYFNQIGREKFKEVFPGRSHVTDEDIIFYRTLAPYTPALVLISEVKDGAIHQFDTDSKDQWRVATKFTYRRIRTS
jgi:hypothetical protein